VPLDWATTQMNFGNPVRILGERYSGMGKVEEEVSAYREALEEFAENAVTKWYNIVQQTLDWANAALTQ
jgi:hypothetical protein